MNASRQETEFSPLRQHDSADGDLVLDLTPKPPYKIEKLCNI
jgi:hypothetical protein